MSALVAPGDLASLDRFTANIQRDIERLGYTAPPVKAIQLTVPVLEAADEYEALRWHSDGVATLTERQADQWSDGVLVYRYATRTDGDRCVVTWPVTS